jgi:murein DD-endopeptidase MepM/ murein hydrolase activator NlpD
MYGHLSRVTVAAGQAVDAGQVIGLSGNSGRSSAPHLHFEVRHDGQPIDPRTLVKEQS